MCIDVEEEDNVETFVKSEAKKRAIDQKNNSVLGISVLWPPPVFGNCRRYC